MTKSILTVSAWKVVVAFVVSLIIAEMIARTTASYFDWNRQYGAYPTLRFGLMTLALWSYPILVGMTLSRQLYGSGAGLRRRILLIILLAILNNTISVLYAEANGVVGLVVLMTAALNTYCLVAIVSFPARMLRSVELKEIATFAEYWREIPQFVVWPFSIWWMQPRLASIVIEEDAVNKENTVRH